MTDLLLCLEQRTILKHWVQNHLNQGKVRPEGVTTSAIRNVLGARKASIPLVTLRALIDGFNDSSILELLRWPATKKELEERKSTTIDFSR